VQVHGGLDDPPPGLRLLLRTPLEGVGPGHVCFGTRHWAAILTIR
jgi:hypothetical protein